MDPNKHHTVDKAALKTAQLREMLKIPFEERVAVNQRGLINKILSRYSSDFTCLRELLQNADDAGAKLVRVMLERDENRWTHIRVSNDGKPFSEDDWKRLKTIATGNPSEDVVGMFGVGFYSVFALTETPQVHSGSQAMKFKFVENELFAELRVLQEPEQLTTVACEIKKDTEADNWKINRLQQFLVETLAFPRNILTVELLCNNSKIMTATRQKGTPGLLEVPESIKKGTQQEVVHLQNMEICDLTISVECLGAAKFSVAFSLAEMELVLNKRNQKGFLQGMKKALEKDLPDKTQLKLLFEKVKVSSIYSKAETADKQDEFTSLEPLFETIRPGENKGRIFIGLATHQSTGTGFHIRANFVPTVERLTIDFVTPKIKVWNTELLDAAGLTARMYYEHQLHKIANKSNQSNVMNWQQLALDYSFSSTGDMQPQMNQISEDSTAKEWQDALTALLNIQNLLKSNSFGASPPFLPVAKMLKEAFFYPDKSTFLVPTSVGLKKVEDAALIPGTFREYQPFISLPYVPTNISNQSTGFFQELADRGWMKSFTFAELLINNNKRFFSEKEIGDLLRWYLQHQNQLLSSIDATAACEGGKRSKLEQDTLRKLLQSIRMASKGKEIEVILLSSMTEYEPTHKDFHTVYLPKTALPVSVSQRFSAQELEQKLMMHELTFTKWWSEVTSKNLVEQTSFAAGILGVLYRNLSTFPTSEQEEIFKYLQSKRCILANDNTMKLPSEVYFPGVQLFKDLPHYMGLQDLPQSFLKLVGIREEPDADIVLNRMKTKELKWNMQQIVSYFLSRANSLSASEWETLRSRVKKGYYLPKPELKELGLNTLPWNEHTTPLTPAIESFLIQLGVASHPPLEDLLILCSDSACIEKARDFLIQHVTEFYPNDYDSQSIDVAFIPTEEHGMQAPRDCFIYPSPFDTPVVSSQFTEHAGRLGVLNDPPLKTLIDLVADFPPSLGSATAVFEYFAERSEEFTPNLFQILRDISFIPYLENSALEYMNPAEVVFRNAEDEYGCLLDYVDFGEKANDFLQQCGVQTEPSVHFLVYQILKNYQRFLKTEGAKKYLMILRQIAVHTKSLMEDEEVRQQMEEIPFLIAFKDSEQKGWVTCRANECFILDNIKYQKLFECLGVPTDPVLKELYIELGSKQLTSCIQREFRISENPEKTRQTKFLESNIRQRRQFFLQDMSTVASKRTNLYSTAEDSLDNLSIFEVKRIEQVLKLGEKQAEEPATVCIRGDRENPVMYVTKGFTDFLGIADELAHLLLKTVRVEDGLIFHTLLSTSLDSLRSQGYPVDLFLGPEKPLEDYLEDDSQNYHGRKYNQSVQYERDEMEEGEEEEEQEGSDDQSVASEIPHDPDEELSDSSVEANMQKRISVSDVEEEELNKSQQPTPEASHVASGYAPTQNQSAVDEALVTPLSELYQKLTEEVSRREAVERQLEEQQKTRSMSEIELNQYKQTYRSLQNRFKELDTKYKDLEFQYTVQNRKYSELLMAIKTPPTHQLVIQTPPPEEPKQPAEQTYVQDIPAAPFQPRISTIVVKPQQGPTKREERTNPEAKPPQRYNTIVKSRNNNNFHRKEESSWVPRQHNGRNDEPATTQQISRPQVVNHRSSFRDRPNTITNRIVRQEQKPPQATSSSQGKSRPNTISPYSKRF